MSSHGLGSFSRVFPEATCISSGLSWPSVLMPLSLELAQRFPFWFTI
jgi:hypothetical protein